MFSPSFPKVYYVIDSQKILAGKEIKSLEHAETKEAIDIRDPIMSDVMCAFKGDGNAISFVGSGHLRRLMKKTNLHDSYYVVPINVNSYGSQLKFDDNENQSRVEKDTKYYLTSEKVNRFFCKLGRFDQINFFTAEEIIKLSNLRVQI